MSNRLCRCGAIVDGPCIRCTNRSSKSGTTTQRGYGHDWRKFSERFRQLVPLCQVCELSRKATPAVAVHHIAKIAEAPQLRLSRANVLSVCKPCHDVVETDGKLARRAKAESEQEN